MLGDSLVAKFGEERFNSVERGSREIPGEDSLKGGVGSEWVCQWWWGEYEA
jgi:hypothetical protein